MEIQGSWILLHPEHGQATDGCGSSFKQANRRMVIMFNSDRHFRCVHVSVSNIKASQDLTYRR